MELLDLQSMDLVNRFQDVIEIKAEYLFSELEQLEEEDNGDDGDSAGGSKRVPKDTLPDGTDYIEGPEDDE